MREVKLDTISLMTTLEKNRKKHQVLYEETIEGYYRALIDWLHEQLTKAEARESIESYHTFSKPIDHTDDYDDVLDMLRLSTDDEVTLTQEEFCRYIKDDWDWKHDLMRLSDIYSRR